jgi:hypothetical protein
MAAIKTKLHPRRTAASQQKPLSFEERSSAPLQPAAVPDIPSPLGELPAEGSSSVPTKQEYPAGKKTLGAPDKADDKADLASKAGAIFSPRTAVSRPGVRRGTRAGIRKRGPAEK